MKKCIFFGLTAFLLAGCTQTFVELTPQSHFDYPNSNIYPLGHVKGQASTTSFFVPDMPSSIQYEAVAKALEQKPGSDILVNAFHFTDVTQLLILPIFTITYRVEGTAAKMTAGEQSLH